MGLLLNYKAKPFDFSTVFCSGGHDIDSSGIDTAVAKNIRQFCNILFNAVKSSGKELPKIMREHFGGIHTCRCAKPLHLCPDVTAVHRFSVLRNENNPALNTPAFRIIQ